MHERMLDKSVAPTFEEMLAFCGEAAQLWQALEAHFQEEYNAVDIIRFTRKNKYGWSKKYSTNGKYICDVFAEKNTFLVFFRISNTTYETICAEISGYVKEIWKNSYNCGKERWVDFEVLTDEHLEDVKKLIKAKMTVK